MIERLNRKIQECKYNAARKKFMNLWIPNLGTIKEEEDKIICYVRQELLERYMKRKGYTISCYGIPMHEKVKQKVEYYQLDKPVYYIFDGIQFDFIKFFFHF